MVYGQRTVCFRVFFQSVTVADHFVAEETSICGAPFEGDQSCVINDRHHVCLPTERSGAFRLGVRSL